MPTSVKWVRALLYVMAGFAVLLLGVVTLAGFTAAEAGAAAAIPMVLGLAGVLLALAMRPGRRAIRLGIIVVQALWLLAGLGWLGQGDPTGLAMLIGGVAVAVLVNTRSARRYFAPAAREGTA